MILNSNFVLKHTVWEKLQDFYPVQGALTKPKFLIFRRLVDLFVVCVSIGVKENLRIPNNTTDDIASINSKTYNDPVNDDLKKTLDFILKIMILTCDLNELKHLSQAKKEELAFSSEFTVENFNGASAMCEFANYGALKISEIITENDISTIEELLNYIDGLKEETLPDVDLFESI